MTQSSPQPTLLIKDFAVTEGQDAVFIIGSSSIVTGPNTVHLYIDRGTAEESDYNLSAAQISYDGVNFQPFTNDSEVSIAIGKDCIYIKVPTVDDGLVEHESFADTEKFTITANPVDGFSGGAVVETASIIDNDIQRISVVSNGDKTEGDYASWTISIDKEPDRWSWTQLDLVDGTTQRSVDYDPNTLEVSIDGGSNWQSLDEGDAFGFAFKPGLTSAQVRVKTTDDSVVENTESLILKVTPNTEGLDILAPDVVQATVNIKDNDAGVPNPVQPKVVSVSSPRAVEGDLEVFDIQLSSPTTAPTTVVFGVTLETASETDLAGNFEYSFDGTNWSTLNNARVEVPTGKSSFQVRVLAATDQLVEGDETFRLTAGTDSGSATGIATITNKAVIAPPTPVQVASVGNTTAPEGDFEVFKVNLTAPTTAPTKVDLVLTGDSAIIGTDFENKLETSFDGGQTWSPVTGTSVDVAVGKSDFLVRTKALNDEVVEGAETFKLTATGNGGTATGVGTIEDKTVLVQPKVVSVSSPRADEGDREVFDILLSAAGTTPTSVTLNLTPGSATAADLAGNLEYSLDGTTWLPVNGSTVDVPAGKTTFQVRTLTAVDQLVEGDETFTLTAGSNGGTATGTATILDKTVLSKVASVGNATAPEGDFEVFKVNLTAPTTAPTKVDLVLTGDSATIGTDFENKLETSFDGGQTWSPVTGTSVDVAVGKSDFLVRTKALNDEVVEGAETFKLTATGNGGTATGVGTIEDKTVLVQPKVVSVSSPRADEGDREVFDILLSAAGTTPTSVTLNLTPGSATAADLAGNLEYSLDGTTWLPVNGSTVDVPAGKTTFQVRTLTAVDQLVEGDETFTLTAGSNGGTATGTATILDKTVLSKVASVGNATAPEGDFEVFKVNLTAPTTAPTKVDLVLTGDSATIGTDFENKLETSFDGGQTWSPVTGTSVDVAVGKSDFLVRTKALNDEVLEGAETFKLTATGNGGTATGVGTIEDKTVLVQPKVVSVSSPRADEGDREVFDIQLSAAGITPTTVTLNLTPGTATAADLDGALEYSLDGTTWLPVNGSTVDVPAGKNTFQVRTLTAVDQLVEGDETFTLTAGSNGGTATGTATILDKTVLSKVASVGNATAPEGDFEVFKVNLTAPTTAPTKVDLVLTGDSATIGTDFENKLETSFDGGQTWSPVTGTSVDVAVGKSDFLVRTKALNDEVLEGAETFKLTATGNGGTATGVGTIEDKTVLVQPKVVSVSSPRADEGDREVFDILLSAAGTTPTSVTLNLTPGTATAADLDGALEYSLDGTTWLPVNGSTVDVPAGKTTFQVRTLTAIDQLVEGDETFTLTAGSNGGTATGTATILDKTVLSKVASVGNATAPEGDFEVFKVNLTAPTTAPTKVDLVLTGDSATIGTDFENKLETSFDGGQTWSPVTGTSVDVAVGKSDFLVRTKTNTDNIFEGNETLKLTAAANGGSGTGTGTIEDGNPAPKVTSVSSPTAVEGQREVFTVQLSGVSTIPTDVQISLTPDSATLADLQGSLEVSFDGTTWTTINGSTVTVPAGRNDFQIRTLTNDDTLVEGSETFKLTATANGGAATGIATITDNDVKPAPKAKLVGNNEIHEGGDHGKYTVQLDQISDKDQFFTIQINNGKAQRYDGDGKGQDFVWGGAFDIAGTGKVFYGRVPNDNINGYNNRAAVGPNKGDASWDYSVYQGGKQKSGDTITVKVAAGQTTSDEFSIQAWKEKVTVDQDYRNPNGLNTTNYNEGQENFSLKITNAGGIEVTQGELGVKITDKTHYNLVSPIAIDLNGDGIQTIALEQGVTFDIFNSGQQTNVGWLSGNDGFLAIDNNNNGEIDDRSELFGGNVGEGFAKLETFDSNKDGVVNNADDLFGNLKIWRDGNVNGKTETGELASLNAANIATLNVAYTSQFLTDSQGNILGEKSTAIDTNGKALDMIDVYFRTGQ